MKIIAFAEQRDNQFKKICIRSCPSRKDNRRSSSRRGCGLVIGDAMFRNRTGVGAYGAAKVIVVEDPRLEYYSVTAYAKIVADIVRKENPEAAVFSASPDGERSCAPYCGQA